MADYKILTIPFARDALPDMVNDIPDAPSVPEPQLASWQQGFPYITTIPPVAGGRPPEGQDFNGILRDITQHIVHQNKGGMYKFAPEVVAAGGYPEGAVLAANDNLSLWVSLQNNNVQDFNTVTPTQWARIAFSGLDALLNTKADKAVSINAGTGLTGGGTLAASRTLSVSYGTTAGTAAQGNDSRITGAAQKSANLSDLTNPATARTNLGLDALLNGKVDKTSIVQATGTSTTNIMSQNAVTDALAGVDKFNATPVTVASASTVNLTTGAPNTSQITITGTASISAFTVAVGRTFVVKFTGACTLVNSGSLVTGTGANISVDAGDSCIIRATAANVVEVLDYASKDLIGRRVTASASDQTVDRLVKNGDKQICTAWVNFDGTGTVAIRDSYNVSSITDNGVGNYTVNFAVAMANANYAVVASCNSSTTTPNALLAGPNSKTVASCGIGTQNGAGSSGDYPIVDVAFFGGK